VESQNIERGSRIPESRNTFSDFRVLTCDFQPGSVAINRVEITTANRYEARLKGKQNLNWK